MGNDHSQQRNLPGKTEMPTRTSRSQSFDGENEGSPVDNLVSSDEEIQTGEMADGFIAGMSPGEDSNGTILSGLPGEIVPESLLQDTAQEDESIIETVVSTSLRHQNLTNASAFQPMTVIPIEDTPTSHVARTRVPFGELDSQLSEINSRDIGNSNSPTLFKVHHSIAEEMIRIEEVEKNRKCAMTLDKTGLFKRRVTRDTDDNRRVFGTNNSECDSLEQNLDDNFKSVLSNIMFFPDKSKGALPKRYGPRRLGKAANNFSDISGSSSVSSDTEENLCYEDDLGELSSDFKGPQRSDSMKALIGDELGKQTDSESNPPDQHQTGVISSSESLTFVEDHFGLLTGSEATGGASTIVPQADRSIPSHVSTDGISNEINQMVRPKPPDTTHISIGLEPEFSRSRQPGFGDIVRETARIGDSERTVNLTSLDGGLTCSGKDMELGFKGNCKKTKFNKRKKRHKEKYASKSGSGFKNTNTSIQVDSVIDFCSKCKQKSDICDCLLLEYETYTLRERRFAEPACKRFSRLCGKKVPWSVLASKQAKFAATLKSYKTGIADDNRMCLEFNLPSYTGQCFKSTPTIQIDTNLSKNPKHDSGIRLSLQSTNSDGAFQHMFAISSDSFPENNIIVNNLDDLSDEEQDVNTRIDEYNKDRADQSSLHLSNIGNTRTDLDNIEGQIIDSGIFDIDSNGQEAKEECRSEMKRSELPGELNNEPVCAVGRCETTQCKFGIGCRGYCNGKYSAEYTNPTYNLSKIQHNNGRFDSTSDNVACVFSGQDMPNAILDGNDDDFCNHIVTNENLTYFDSLNEPVQSLDSVDKETLTKQDELHSSCENEVTEEDEVICTEDNKSPNQVPKPHSDQHYRETIRNTSIEKYLPTSESDASILSAHEESLSAEDTESMNSASGIEQNCFGIENSDTKSENIACKPDSNLQNNEKCRQLSEDSGINDNRQVTDSFTLISDIHNVRVDNESALTLEARSESLEQYCSENNIGLLKRHLTQPHDDNRTSYLGSESNLEHIKATIRNEFQMNFCLKNSQNGDGRGAIGKSSFGEGAEHEDQSQVSNTDIDHYEERSTSEDIVSTMSKQYEETETIEDIEVEEPFGCVSRHSLLKEHPIPSNRQEKGMEAENERGSKSTEVQMTTEQVKDRHGNSSYFEDKMIDKKKFETEMASRSVEVKTDIFEREIPIQWRKVKLTRYIDDNRLAGDNYEWDPRTESTQSVNIGIHSRSNTSEPEESSPVKDNSPDESGGWLSFTDPFSLEGYASQEPMSRMLKEMADAHQKHLRTLLSSRDRFHRRILERPSGEKSDFVKSLYECAEQGLEILVDDDDAHVNRSRRDSSSSNSSVRSSSIVDLESLEFLQRDAVEKVKLNLTAKVNKNERKVPTVDIFANAGDDRIGFQNDRGSKEDLANGLAGVAGSEGGTVEIQQDLPAESLTTSPVIRTGRAKLDVEEGADLSKWNSQMEEQLAKCKAVKGLPHSCRATVLCVDASSKMQGDPWIQTKAHIRTFLQYLDEIQNSHGIQEYVALVVFGQTTEVKIQLCTEYYQIRMEVERMVPDGPCNMLPGLAMALHCLAPFKGRRYAQVHDIILENRVILFSSGHPDCWQYYDPKTGKHEDRPGSDAASLALLPFKAVQDLQSSLESWVQDKIIEDAKTGIHCVPIGHNPNMVCFEAVKSAIAGTRLYYDQVQQLGRSTHNHYIAAQISNQMFETSEEFDVASFKLFLHTLFPGRTEHDVSDIFNIAENSHVEYVARKNQPPSNPDSPDYRLGVKNLPPLGSRVTQGPDMSPEKRSFVSEKGTIIQHVMESRGQVFVRWDNGFESSYDLGNNGKCDVVPDEVQVQCCLENPVKLGDTVRRGPDWKFGNQDGGGDQIGRVHSLIKGNIVLVRWNNGNFGNYRCGQAGIYDVIISEAEDPDGMATFTADMNRQNAELNKNEQRNQ